MNESIRRPNIFYQKRILIFSVITLVIGIIGYLIYLHQWPKYIFAHIGALGIIGIITYFIGNLADKKGLHYKKAVLLGFSLPIILGILADDDED